MAAWLDALVLAERDGQPAVLVTVLAAKGSTPREAGAKMVVSADGLAGTIGGETLNISARPPLEACSLVAPTAHRPGISRSVPRWANAAAAMSACCSRCCGRPRSISV